MTDPPWLVFMNACESAKTMDSRELEQYRELSGLATTFLAAGASSYIGTRCRGGLTNGNHFYQKLLTGSSIGQSMQHARKEFFEQHEGDLSWLAFRLYGNPTLKRDLVAEVSMDKEDCVKEYVEKKRKTGNLLLFISQPF